MTPAYFDSVMFKSGNSFSAFYQSATLLTEPPTEPKWAIRVPAAGISNRLNLLRMQPPTPCRPRYASLPNFAELGF